MNKRTKTNEKMLQVDESENQMTLEEKMSIVSHYVHNRGYSYSKAYEEKARELIKEMYNKSY